MDFSSLPLFDVLHHRLGWLTQRQRVLAENIANADTPRFRPMDLDPFTAPADDAGAKTPMMRTQPLHLPEAGGVDAAAQVRRQRQVYEATPSGNAVVLEEQMAKLNETAVAHQLATQLYKKYLGLVRLAATARG